MQIYLLKLCAWLIHNKSWNSMSKFFSKIETDKSERSKKMLPSNFDYVFKIREYLKLNIFCTFLILSNEGYKNYTIHTYILLQNGFKASWTKHIFIFLPNFDDFSKWSTQNVLQNLLWKIIKIGQKMKDCLVQLALNPFFVWF